MNSNRKIETLLSELERDVSSVRHDLHNTLDNKLLDNSELDRQINNLRHSMYDLLRKSYFEEPAPDDGPVGQLTPVCPRNDPNCKYFKN